MNSRSGSWILLGMVLLLGAALRFWHLDLKPLWLDEVITALFSLGRSYADVPVEGLFPLPVLRELFTYQPGLGWGEIVRRVSTESVHPPLFFCLMYSWMGWLNPQGEGWVWALRSLSALFGVGAIAALYGLNRVAFSMRAGLLGAALMAVSPFAVYLSQEARHYTLPMGLITLALMALVLMQQDLQRQQVRLWVWIGWVGINAVGLYVHYFVALALVAQVAALGGWMLLQRRSIGRRGWMALGLAIATIVLLYLPWLPTMLSHFSRPETDWLEVSNPDWSERIAPLYQSAIGWVLMVISLPVEDQPLAIAVLLGALMFLFACWVLWQAVRGWRSLWREGRSRPALLLVGGFTLCVLLEFFGIVYLLGKDLTLVPRYNFVYYPGVCALLGACLTARAEQAPPSRPWWDRYRAPIAVLLVGVFSSALVANGFVFQKSYHPDTVAQRMRMQPEQPLMVIMSYRSDQEIALGLSFALALRQLYLPGEETAPFRFGFLQRERGYGSIWRKLYKLKQPLPLPLNLWIIAAPGMKAQNYPIQLAINDPNAQQRGDRGICLADAANYYRRGFPQQRYRCNPEVERN